MKSSIKRFAGLLTLVCVAFAGCSTAPRETTSAKAETSSVRPSAPTLLLQQLLAHDPETDLPRIIAEAEQLVSYARPLTKQAREAKRRRKKELADLPYAELQAHFHPPATNLNAHEIRAVEELLRAARIAITETNRSSAAWKEVRELTVGLRNHRQSPVPEETGALSPWKLLIQNSRRSIGHGKTPSTNLPFAAAGADLSRLDPLPSPFWQRPTNIAAADLAAGFGRKTQPDLADRMWEYDNPKTSSGTRPGFEVQFGREEYKIKFAEESSEPFTARIFHALGYHVDPTDYVPQVKVRYDRRILREFNMREPLVMRLRPFWIPMGTLQLQPYYDPFKFVQAAVFKDGSRVTGLELRERLLRDPRVRGEEDPANFRTEVEETIDHLVFGAANVQSKESRGETVGAWDFQGLGHEDLRELRGAGLLSAWLTWFDSRFDNTRIRAIETDNGTRLEYFFTDLGSGMGRGTGGFIRHGEDPGGFEWRFTRPPIVRGPGRMTTPFRVIHFNSIIPTPAFQRMTVDDARWMARLIAELTPSQIAAALKASGYNEADANLYLAKLLERRRHMLNDLGLNGEY